MKKKIKFKRQQSILKKLGSKWIRPRGLQSKLRLKKRGKSRRPKIGYGNEKKLRYLIKGKKPVYISNIKEMENLKQPIIISSNVGLKKKIDIIKKAKELSINILNIKNADKFLDDVKKRQEEKKKSRLDKEKKVKKEEKVKEESKEEKETKLKEEKRKVLEKGLK